MKKAGERNMNNMAISNGLKNQCISYLRYKEMQFQTEYIFSTCREVRKEHPEDEEKKLFIRIR